MVKYSTLQSNKALVVHASSYRSTTLLCADPYARVVFANGSAVTLRIDRTLCPVWDETLIFENILLVGDPEHTEDSSPDVVIELYDYDQIVLLLFI